MKGQISFVEFIVSFTVFSIFVAYLFFRLAGYMPVYLGEIRNERVRTEAYLISELLVNDPGEPMDWGFVPEPPEDGCPPGWWNSDWEYRKKLTFDNSGQSEDLDDFPILVKLDSSFDYGKTKADGTDLRFIDSDNTELKYQLKYHIEKWNPSGESFVWVKVPNIPASSSTDYIWMYYGNDAAGDAQDGENTYDSNFVGVWHLNEPSGTVYDSTNNNNDGVNNVSGRNQVKNPSFEMDKQDWGTGEGDWVIVTDEKYHGSKSSRFQDLDGTPGSETTDYVYIPVTPNVPITISTYSKGEDIVVGTLDWQKALILARWLDSAGSVISGLSLPYTEFPDVIIGDGTGTWDWKRSSTTHLPPPGAVQYRFIPGLRDDASGTLWVDAIQIEYGSTATDFTDSPLTSGMVDDALDFDGYNDYISINSINDPTSTLSLQAPLSVEAWIYPKEGSTGDIFAHGQVEAPPWLEYQIATVGPDLGYEEQKIGFWTNTEGSTNELLSDQLYYINTWYYVVGTWDGSTMRLYINGIEDNFMPASGNIDEVNQISQIGYWSPTSAEFFNGTIDEVKVSNVARSESWIKASYLSMTDNFITHSAEEPCIGEAPACPSDWWDSSYQYRKPVTINSANALSNYQVLVEVDTSSLIAAVNMKANCDDIRFANPAKNELKYWIEADCDNPNTRIWVKVPNIPVGTSTIYMYYGNDVASASDYDNTMQKLEVDGSTVGLWHLDESSGSTTADSSGNGNDCNLLFDTSWEASDGGHWDNRTDVKFSTGSALTFDRVDDRAECGNDPSLDITDELTIEAWAKVVHLPEEDITQYVVAKRNSYGLGVGHLNSPKFVVFNETGKENRVQLKNFDRITGKWTHLAGTFDLSTKEMKLYINGSLDNTKTFLGNSIQASADDLTLGSWGTILFIEGTIDEVRILNRSLAAEEIKADYERRKFSDPEPTSSVGDEEECTGEAPACSSDWWDSSYSYRQRIDVKNNDVTALSDYSLNFTLDTASLTGTKMLANGDDLRIVYKDGSSWVELDRDLIEFDSSNTGVLFKTYKDIAGPTILFEDNFNDGDASDWSTHGGGTWIVQDGYYSQTTNVDKLISYPDGGDTSWDDYTVIVKHKLDDDDTSGILFRYNQEAFPPALMSGYAFITDNIGVPNNLYSSPNTLLLWKFDGTGSPPQTLASVNIGLIGNDWNEMKVVVNGGNIKAYFNDELIFDIDDPSPILTGQIGLTSRNQVGAHFDDVVVYSGEGSDNNYYMYYGNPSATNPPLNGLYSNAVGWWRFNEGIGDVTIDDSSEGNDGTYNGETFNDGILGDGTCVPGSGNCPDRISGYFGKGLDFAGDDDYVDVSTFSSHTYNEFTITAWYKSTDSSVTDDQYIFYHSGAAGVMFGATDDGGFVDRFRFGIWWGSSYEYYGTSDIVDQTWKHLAAVRNSTYVNLYVNGMLESSTIDLDAGTPGVANGIPYIGDNPGNTEQVKGTVDELRIYDRSLTEAEINAEMQSSRPIERSAASWSFEEEDSANYVNDTHIWIKKKYDPWVKGEFSSALSFDGDDDHVDVGNPTSLQLTGAMTVEAWIKADAYDGAFVSKQAIIPNRGFKLKLHMDTVEYRHIEFQVAPDDSTLYTLNTSGEFPLNEWHHIAAVYEPSTYTRIYIDGVKEAENTTDVPSSQYNNDNSVTIGMRPDMNTRFNGTIDEVRIYNRALTDDEIKANYNKFVLQEPTVSRSSEEECTGAPTGWWNGNWQYRMSLTFDNSRQSGSLDNFPPLVKLSSSNFDYSKAKDDGTDLRFFDPDTSTVLSYHIEKWDSAGESFVWVKVPNIPASSSADYIWMYYGNPSAGYAQDEEGTYDSNFVGVWHLNESSGTVYDSTNNNNDGTPFGGPTYGVGGMIANALQFDQNDDNISASINGFDMARGTISFWYKPEYNHDDGNYHGIFKLGGFSVPNDEFSIFKWMGGSNYLEFDIENSSDDSSYKVHPSDYSWVPNQWVYLTFIWDDSKPTPEQMAIYQNATKLPNDYGISKNYDSSAYSTPTGMGIGRDTGSAYGVIDEFRISNIVRSESWINASNLTMTCQFTSYGSEEEYTGPPPPPPSGGLPKRIGLSDIANKTNLVSLGKVSQLNTMCQGDSYYDVKALLGTEQDFSLYLKTKPSGDLLLSCSPPETIYRGINISVKRFIAFTGSISSSGSWGSWIQTTVADFNADEKENLTVVDVGGGDGDVELTPSFLTGNLTSLPIFDAGSEVDWDTISWRETKPLAAPLSFDTGLRCLEYWDINDSSNVRLYNGAWLSGSPANANCTSGGNTYRPYGIKKGDYDPPPDEGTPDNITVKTPSLPQAGYYTLEFDEYRGNDPAQAAENFSVVCGGVVHDFPDDVIGPGTPAVQNNRSVICPFDAAPIVNEFAYNSTDDDSAWFTFFRVLKPSTSFDSGILCLEGAVAGDDDGDEYAECIKDTCGYTVGEVNNCGADGFYYVHSNGILNVTTPDLLEAGDYTLTFEYYRGSPGEDESFQVECGGIIHDFPDDDLPFEEWRVKTITCPFDADVNEFNITSTTSLANSVYFDSFAISMPLDIDITDIIFRTRFGDTPAPDASWSGWSAPYTNPAGEAITSPSSRYVQWTADFSTDNVLFTPVLHDVTVTFSTAPAVTTDDKYGELIVQMW